MAPEFRRHRSDDRDDTSRPVVITGARESYRDELAARKKRYFLLMSIRIPALLLAAGSLAIWNNPWIALAIVGGSIPIPWIAVIGANDRPPLPKSQARAYTAGRLGTPTQVRLPAGLTGGPTSSEHAAQERRGEREGEGEGEGAGTGTGGDETGRETGPRATTDPADEPATTTDESDTTQ